MQYNNNDNNFNIDKMQTTHTQAEYRVKFRLR